MSLKGFFTISRISHQKPGYHYYEITDTFRSNLKNPQKQLTPNINLVNPFRRLEMVSPNYSTKDSVPFSQLMRKMSQMHHIISLEIKLGFIDERWVKIIPNLCWISYRYSDLKQLEVYLGDSEIKQGLILNTLKQRFRNLDLKVFNLTFSPFSDLVPLESRVNFYQTLRSFHSITGLSFNIVFKLDLRDSFLLAKVLNSLRKLNYLSIKIQRNYVDDILVKFFNYLKALNPNLIFELDFDIEIVKDVEKILNSINYVTKLYLRYYTSPKNLKKAKFKENHFVREIDWNIVNFSEKNEDLMEKLELIKKFVNLEKLIFCLGYSQKVNFANLDFVHEGNRIKYVELNLGDSKIEDQGLLSISSQIVKLRNLETFKIKFTNTKTSQDSFQKFFSSLKRLKFLQKLSIECSHNILYFYDFICEDTRLDTIEIFFNDSSFKNIKPLSEAIRLSKLSVLKLIFYNDQITDEEARSLFEAILLQKTLKEIELYFAQCCKITRQTVETLLSNLACNLLFSARFNFQNMNIFRIESQNVLKNFFSNPSLKALSLDLDLYTGKDGLESITKILRDSFLLERLNLHLIDDKKSISARSLLEFSEALRRCKYMKTLELEINKLYHIKHEEIIPIFEAVRDLDVLETLHVKLIINKRDSRIMNDYIKSLIQYVKNKNVNNHFAFFQ